MKEDRHLPTPTEFSVVQIDINQDKNTDTESNIVNPIKNQIQSFINANISNNTP